MRLIDADALIEQMEADAEQMEEPLAKMFAYAAINDVKHAPTVEAPDINVGNIDTTTHDSIPAETGKNDGDGTSGDCISRQAAKDIFTELYGISAIGSVFDKYEWADICETTANELPPTEPYTIHSDGRLWVTVDDIDKVNAVVVDESKSKFCKQFYIDAQPERKTGQWITHLYKLGKDRYECDSCHKRCDTEYCYCPNCGADMRGNKDATN